MLITAPVSAAVVTKIDNRTFTLPDGFTIEKLPARRWWIGPSRLTLMSRGIFTFPTPPAHRRRPNSNSREKPHRIVKLTDTDGDGKFDKQTVYADKMMFPEGDDVVRRLAYCFRRRRASGN